MNGKFLTLASLMPLLSVTTTICEASVTAQNIHQYVERGELAEVNVFLDSNKNIDSIDSSGNSLLHVAVAESQNDEMAESLIQRGAEINAVNMKGETPLELALDDAESASLVRTLLENGADMDLMDNSGHSIYESAVYEKKANYKILQEFRVEHQIQDLAIAKNEDSEKLERLVQNGNISALELRLQQKWNPNSRDNSGNTLLHLAVQKKNSKMIELLLRYGANINAPNLRGETPLHIAVNSGFNDMASLLLKNGANFKLQDNSGYDVDYYATKNKEKNRKIFELINEFKQNPVQQVQRVNPFQQSQMINPDPAEQTQGINPNPTSRVQRVNPNPNPNQQGQWVPNSFQQSQMINPNSQAQRSTLRRTQSMPTIMTNGTLYNNGRYPVQYQGNVNYVPVQNGYYQNVQQSNVPSAKEQAKQQRTKAIGSIANALISAFTA